MGYIGAHGVKALHKHKYSGVDHSYVAKYVLQLFWSRVVTFFPLWMPPNAITLTGFMFLLTSALLGYSLLYLPLAIANALTARLNDGITRKEA